MKLRPEVVRKRRCLAKRRMVFGTFLCHYHSIAELAATVRN